MFFFSLLELDLIGGSGDFLLEFSDCGLFESFELLGHHRIRFGKIEETVNAEAVN